MKLLFGNSLICNIYKKYWVVRFFTLLQFVIVGFRPASGFFYDSPSPGCFFRKSKEHAEPVVCRSRPWGEVWTFLHTYTALLKLVLTPCLPLKVTQSHINNRFLLLEAATSPSAVSLPLPLVLLLSQGPARSNHPPLADNRMAEHPDCYDKIRLQRPGCGVQKAGAGKVLFAAALWARRGRQRRGCEKKRDL